MVARWSTRWHHSSYTCSQLKAVRARQRWAAGSRRRRRSRYAHKILMPRGGRGKFKRCCCYYEIIIETVRRKYFFFFFVNGRKVFKDDQFFDVWRSTENRLFVMYSKRSKEFHRILEEIHARVESFLKTNFSISPSIQVGVLQKCNYLAHDAKLYPSLRTLGNSISLLSLSHPLCSAISLALIILRATRGVAVFSWNKFLIRNNSN